jgi:hypothetical protein
LLADSLLANLHTISAEFQSDGCGDPRTVRLETHLSFSAASPGLYLNVFVHNRMRWASNEFQASLSWKPATQAVLPALPGRGKRLQQLRRDAWDKRAWLRLGSAWLADSPEYRSEEDFDRNSQSTVQYEKYDTRHLTAETVGNIRAALFGDGSLFSLAASAFVSQAALVDILIAASGWSIRALQTGECCWLEHAFCIAAGAPAPKDFEPPSITHAQCAWAEYIFEQAADEGEEEPEGLFAPGVSHEERARLLWEFAEENGHLPWTEPPWMLYINQFKRHFMNTDHIPPEKWAELVADAKRNWHREQERKRLREEAELDGEDWEEEVEEEEIDEEEEVEEEGIDEEEEVEEEEIDEEEEVDEEEV